MDKALDFYIVSDSVGETSLRVVNASLAQFPALSHSKLRRFPFIESEAELLQVLDEAKQQQAVVVATLVNPKFDKVAHNYAVTHDIIYINPINELINAISQRTGYAPLERSGTLHTIDDFYFDRIQAIEFAVKYDDGKNRSGYPIADIVLLGISRSSKTPLSMYLANRSYKVANLPLFPESPVPDILYDLPKEKVFGLIASPQYTASIRKERIKHLGLPEDASYSNIERIKEEYRYALDLYHQLGIPIVNIENKSIEELAEEILQIYEKH